VINYNHFHVGG